MNTCRSPEAEHNLAFTELTRSLTAICLGGTLQMKPAFCSIERSVLPPADVFLCLEAGSGYTNIFLPGYLRCISEHISSVFELQICISSITYTTPFLMCVTTAAIGSRLKSIPMCMML